MYSNKDEGEAQSHMARRADGGMILTRTAMIDECCDMAQMQLVALKSIIQSFLSEDIEVRKTNLMTAMTAMVELGGWLEKKRGESTVIQNAKEIAKDNDRL